MNDAEWDIRRAGRAWGSEAMERYDLTPEKLEMVEGRLLWNDEERVRLLALLLENVGADRAVQLGDLSVWLGAVAARSAEATRPVGDSSAEESGWPYATYLTFVLRQLIRSQQAYHDRLDARLRDHERRLREITRGVAGSSPLSTS